MQERHINRLKYFQEQSYTTEKYVMPFIEKITPISNITSVLEIGCGEGGNMKPFLDAGCKVTGVDLSKGKIENAHKFFKGHKNISNLNLVDEDIYNIDNLGKFDLIITRDVLEHIHNQEKFLNYVKKFLNPNGKFFVGFPPWQSPFGGHQQMCESKFLSKLPYFHLLPTSIYQLILKIFGEKEDKIKGLVETKATRITIEKFERIVKKTGYTIDKKKFYLINPNYEIKFKLKPRKQLKLLSFLPFIRDLITTTVYYLISLKTITGETQCSHFS